MARLPGRSMLNGTMRKLAREAVIFCFIGALISGVLALAYQNSKIIADSTAPPCNDRWLSSEPCQMDGKVIPQLTSSMCIGELIDGKCTKLSAEGEAAEAKAGSIALSVLWKAIPQLLGVFALFAFVIGFPAGFAVWSVYRLARFAITG